jgi:hypothetical protein
MRGPENQSRDWIGLLILIGLVLALIAANNTCTKDVAETNQSQVMVVENAKKLHIIY